MLHPDTVIRTVSDAIGVGVFATRRIPRGTITWVRDPMDLGLSTALVKSLDPMQKAIVDRYAWREGHEWILCWDHGRYVNHACDANCIGMAEQFEIAIRDIEVGEQLTDDYRSLGVFEDPFDCLCGTSMCTGHVAPVDCELLEPVWEARYRAAAVHLFDVEQPLLTYVRRELLPVRSRLERMATAK